MAKRRRMSKKQELRQDPFMEKLQALADYVAANVREIGIGVAAFLVLFLVGIGISNYLASRGMEASARLAEALAAYDEAAAAPGLDEASRAEIQKAVEGLAQVADSYSHTTTGTIALLLAARAAYDLGDYEAAVRRFESIVEGGADDAIALQARRGLGFAQWALGQYDPAQQAFERAIEQAQSEPLRAASRLELARLARAAGRIDEARALAEQVSQSPLAGQWASDAKDLLAMLTSSGT